MRSPIVAMLVLACAHAPPPATDAPEPDRDQERNDALVAADPLCTFVKPSGDPLLFPLGRGLSYIAGDGPTPAEGSRFVVLGPAGYVGEIAIGTPAKVTNRDGASDFVETFTWIDQAPGASTTSIEYVAVGPFSNVVRRGRSFPRRTLEPTAEWAPIAAADLDGDDVADIRVREHRCGCWETIQETSLRRGDTWTIAMRRFASRIEREGPCPKP